MITLAIAMLLSAPLLLLRLDGGSYKQPMSPEREKEYLRRSASGDNAARNELVECNMRLVAHIVKKYYANETDREDLLQIGAIGLIRAISSYRPEKKIALSTYASTCIENEIRMYFRKIRKTIKDVPLDDPLENDREGNPLTLRDLLSSEDDAFDMLLIEESRRRLRQYMDEELDKMEYSVIVSRYGIGGVKPRTQNEIAKELGISRSYVSRIETRAREKLKNRFERE